MMNTSGFKASDTREQGIHFLDHAHLAVKITIFTCCIRLFDMM